MQSRKEKEIDLISWLNTLFLRVLATLPLCVKKYYIFESLS